jgi:histidinol-phosphate/aromatic aminotransferase/cobyric acid decarboxylase-like protein
MAPEVPPKTSKSPRRKLVKFFEKSRDQWKATCREAKVLVKRLKNRVRFLEHSRDRWKEKATTLEAELRRVNAAYTASQQETAALKKTVARPPQNAMR